MDRARDWFKRVYKVIMILVTVTFGGFGIFAYANATPANGLLLIAGILGFLTLIAGLSINKLEWQDERGEAYRQVGQDMRNLLKISTHHISAEPEVHRVDMAALEEARRLDQQGASIDAICRLIDPAYDGHDPIHQGAFRKMVRAMLDG